MNQTFFTPSPLNNMAWPSVSRRRDNIAYRRIMEVDSDGKITKYRLFPSYRLLICFVSFAAVLVLQALHASFNFAWVCMINSTNFGVDHHTADYGGTLPWGKNEQRHAFAAYSLGGIFSLLISGHLVDSLGSRKIFAGALLISTIPTFLIPLLAYHSFAAVVFMRVLVGMGGALTLPLIYNICSHWTTKSEMGKLFCFVSSGIQMGQFAVMLLSASVCEYYGWEWVFNIVGTCGIFYTFVWLIVYSDSPELSKTINTDECTFLVQRRFRSSNFVQKTPWRNIFSSPAVWSCMVGNFAYLYIFFVVGQFSPTYFAEVLHFKVQRNGFSSSLPFLFQLSGRLLLGPILDCKLFAVQPTYALKLFNTVAMLGAGLSTLGLTFLTTESSSYYSVFLLSSILFFTSFVSGGFQKSPLHIAPQHSGVIGGLTNISGMIATVCLPYIVSSLTEHGSMSEWHNVFYSGTAVCLGSGIFFILFGSGDLQPWAKELSVIPQDKNSTDEMIYSDDSEVDSDPDIDLTIGMPA